MNITFIIQNYNYQGGGQVIANLIEKFNTCGHFTKVIVIRCSKYDKQSRPKLKHDVLDLNASNFISGVLKLISIFKTSNDAFISIGGYSNLSAGLAKIISRSSVKIIGSEHFAKSPLLGDYSKFILRLCLPLFKLSYSRLNGLIFVSENLRLKFLKKNQWHPTRCKTIYNPVRFHIKQKNNIDYKKVNSGITFLGIGVLETRKRFDILLRAFSLVASSNDQLLIAGTGSLKTNLKILSKTLKIESQVRFLDYISDVESLLKKSDILVLTSNSEAFGMVLAEGLSQGLQVVSTNCFSGPSEVLNHGKYGFLAEVDNINSVASAMKSAITNPIPAGVIYEGASRFDSDLISKKYLQFIEKISNQNGGINDKL